MARAVRGPRKAHLHHAARIGAVRDEQLSAQTLEPDGPVEALVGLQLAALGLLQQLVLLRSGERGKASTEAPSRELVEPVEPRGYERRRRHHAGALVAAAELTVERVVEERGERVGGDRRAGQQAVRDGGRNGAACLAEPRRPTLFALEPTGERSPEVGLDLADIEPPPELL